VSSAAAAERRPESRRRRGGDRVGRIGDVMAQTHEITLNKVPLRWDLDAGDLTFLGIPSVLFWANPSLYRMLRPLAEHVGAEMFALLVAHESSKGTDEDYHA